MCSGASMAHHLPPVRQDLHLVPQELLLTRWEWKSHWPCLLNNGSVINQQDRAWALLVFLSPKCLTGIWLWVKKLQVYITQSCIYYISFLSSICLKAPDSKLLQQLIKTQWLYFIPLFLWSLLNDHKLELLCLFCQLSHSSVCFCISAAPDRPPYEIQSLIPCPFVLPSPLSSDRSLETHPS